MADAVKACTNLIVFTIFRARLAANFLRPLQSCGGFEAPSLSKAPDAARI